MSDISNITDEWKVRPCPCGHEGCDKWIVEKPFNVDGKFSKVDAQTISMVWEFAVALKMIAEGNIHPDDKVLIAATSLKILEERVAT